MPLLEVRGVTKAYGEGFAVKGVSLSAERGDIVCLLGPSGCGKTTLLRLIAGLETPDAGEVVFDGRALGRTPARSRGFGLMFQDLALFPHMDVVGNVSFGLRMQRRPAEETARRVDGLLRLVGLEGFRTRKVHELSGGERQRVALVRSLAAEPRLLMLDEPLGALDRGLRESLQTQVRAILKALGQTAIYVTHDREEAYAMADAMVIMDAGEVVQAGTPEELYRAPRNELVARSMGMRNVLSGRRVGQTGDVLHVQTDVGFLHGRAAGEAAARPGAEVLALVDERRIGVVPVRGEAEQGARGPDDGPALLPGAVTGRRFHTGEMELSVQAANGALVCLLKPGPDVPAVGDAVTLAVPPDAVRVIATERPRIDAVVDVLGEP